MSDNQDQINRLAEKLKLLIERHNTFSVEIKALRNEIIELRAADNTAPEKTVEAKALRTVNKPKTGELLLDYQPPQPPSEEKSKFTPPSINIGEHLNTRRG